MTRGASALAVAALLVGYAAGCGGGGARRGGGSADWKTLATLPWDRPVAPPVESAYSPEFAVGTVRSVSDDGTVIDIELVRGVARMGDPVTVVMSTPDDPAPRNFRDEVRERRVATAKVVRIWGGGCEARLIPHRLNTMIRPGDRAAVRSP
jgi:hypothetical protein